MKPLVYFLLYLLFSTTTYSQNYKFDLLTNYSATINSEQYDRIVYSNSKNDTYFLSVGGFKGSSKASLYDFKKRIYHKYEVTQTKENNETFFTFKYLSTKKINPLNTYYDYDFVLKKSILTVFSKK